MKKFVQCICEFVNLLSVDFSRIPDDEHILFIGVVSFINLLDTLPNSCNFNLAVFGVVIRFTTIHDPLRVSPRQIVRIAHMNL